MSQLELYISIEELTFVYSIFALDAKLVSANWTIPGILGKIFREHSLEAETFALRGVLA